MTALEDVKTMQSQGLSEDQMVQVLRQRGMKYKDIADALAQTKIRSAIEQPANDPSYSASQASDMQASIMNQQAPGPSQELAPAPQQEYAPSPQVQSQDYAYPQQYEQQTYAQGPSVNSETITEIAEQVVAERLSDIRKYLEKVIDLRTVLESRIDAIDERLKRLERASDVLQSSVLRKVGDYVTNVQDIKTELVEMQKTFSKISPEHKTHQPHPHKEHTKT